MKPKSIAHFRDLYLSATVLTVFNTLSHYAFLREYALSRGSSPAGPILGILLAAVTYLVFWFFIVRRASNIAKWLFVAMTAISVVMAPTTYDESMAIGTAYFLVDALSFILQIAAASILFRDDAAGWLKRRGKEGSA